MNCNKELLAKVTTRLDYDIIKPLLDKYEINTTNRLAGFFAQVGHESADFKYKKESFKYSADRLLKVFPKYFKTKEQAQKAIQEGSIAEIIYGGRKDLGNINPGDGSKFIGRGYIQLTGRNNYTKFANYIGKSLDDTVSYLETEEGAFESALWYWNSHNLNDYCDKDDIIAMTKKINGGTNGLDDRKNRYERYKLLFV